MTEGMTMIERFNEDNTEGYTGAELAEMNRRYEALLIKEGFDPDVENEKSTRDYLAYQVELSIA
jgi:hypothetical protein